MCLTIATADIGAADVLLDRDEHLLVFSPRVPAHDRPQLARRALAEAGVRQPRHAARCVCGIDLFWLPAEQRLPLQRHAYGKAATFASVALVGLGGYTSHLLGSIG